MPILKLNLHKFLLYYSAFCDRYYKYFYLVGWLILIGLENHSILCISCIFHPTVSKTRNNYTTCMKIKSCIRTNSSLETRAGKPLLYLFFIYQICLFTKSVICWSFLERLMQTMKITGWLRLPGTSGGHVFQHSTQAGPAKASCAGPCPECS